MLIPEIGKTGMVFLKNTGFSLEYEELHDIH
jgi:hypothetical protein